ncbi:hypothetical protein MMC25_004984 [Agyrium rufum]|nr:hypothetical protein [Agyrium rufum]
MAQAKPTFLLVPGAWHPQGVLDQLVSELQSAGFENATGTLTTVGSTASLSDDVTYIREELLLPLIEGKGKDVIFVAHSYAGIPSGTAIKGLSKGERIAKGEKGGIVGLVYLCAFVPQQGVSLFDMVGGQWPPWQEHNDTAKTIKANTPESVFYADVPEALHTKVISTLRDQSQQSFTAGAGPVYYADPSYNGRRAYIRTADDQAIPAFGQDAMVQASGVEWITKKFDTSHSPFLSKPKELAETLVSLAADFEKAK